MHRMPARMPIRNETAQRLHASWAKQAPLAEREESPACCCCPRPIAAARSPPPGQPHRPAARASQTESPLQHSRRGFVARARWAARDPWPACYRRAGCSAGCVDGKGPPRLAGLSSAAQSLQTPRSRAGSLLGATLEDLQCTGLAALDAPAGSHLGGRVAAGGGGGKLQSSRCPSVALSCFLSPLFPILCRSW